MASRGGGRPRARDPGAVPVAVADVAEDPGRHLRVSAEARLRADARALPDDLGHGLPALLHQQRDRGRALHGAGHAARVARRLCAVARAVPRRRLADPVDPGLPHGAADRVHDSVLPRLPAPEAARHPHGAGDRLPDVQPVARRLVDALVFRRRAALARGGRVDRRGQPGAGIRPHRAAVVRAGPRRHRDPVLPLCVERFLLRADPHAHGGDDRPRGRRQLHELRGLGVGQDRRRRHAGHAAGARVLVRRPEVPRAGAHRGRPARLKGARPMKRSTERFLTTHTGSLPRPADLIRMMFAREEGVPVDPAALAARVGSAVDEIVRRQVECGLDVVNDGEMSKPSYATYIKDRLHGFGGESHPLVYQDLAEFPELARRVFGDPGRSRRKTPACTGPISVRDRRAAQSDAEIVTAALARAKATEGFLSAASPGVISLFFRDDHYRSHEQYLMAIAEAMRHEYETVARAGLIVQIDCPELVAQRIGRYAKLVGRERVIAGSDCGFGTWVGQAAVDPGVVWAKMQSLAEGARLASREFWPGGRT